MDIASVLLAAQNPDQAIRQPAEQQIEAAKLSNLPLLLNLLASELANEAKELHIRQLAGVVLKNCVSLSERAGSSDDSTDTREQKKQAWLAIGKPERAQIKATVLGALASPQQSARHTAAQVVAAVGVIEVPVNEWPELVQGLVNNVTTSGNEFMKQSSLEALGFLCEEVDPSSLESQSNLILTAVVQGMRKEEANQDVRLAATNAMFNALEFVKTNFENETERNYIMQTVCEGTQAELLDLKVASYECIVQIAELYYGHLVAYMPALYQLTLAAIQQATAQDDQDDVGQQAVEFWSTICEEEMRIAEEEDEEETKKLANFVRQGAAQLMPLLLEAMCKQEDDADDETWNLARAASTCLSKIALTITDEVVGNVMPFVQKYITSEDWHRREAAALAFGSVLEGPSKAALQQYLGPGIDVMITLMRDPVVQVKDTAAWTIGTFCEHHTSAIQPAQWTALTQAPGGAEPEGVLLAGLRDAPAVANNICWALHNLAEQCEDTRDAPTNPLSPLFITLATALLQCADRPDASDHNLRASACEALNTVLNNCAADTKPHLEQLLPVILKRLQDTFERQILTNEDREEQSELQGLLCGTLQVITQKLGAAAVPFADGMMQQFLQVFGAKVSTVHEEALMAVGAIASATEAGFEKYMPHFRPFLSLGLSNYQEHQVCNVAIGVVGDICRALEASVLPYCDEVVHLLLRNLQNPALNRNVKPPILSCFGDIALAIGGQFEKYLQVTMSMLVQAANTVVDEENEDLVEYLNQLREGIFEAYTGVLQGLRADQKSAAFEPYVMSALELVKSVADGHTRGISTDEVIRAAVGVLGDLASSIGSQFVEVARTAPHKEYIKVLIKTAKQSDNDQTKQVGQWAAQAMKVT